MTVFESLPAWGVWIEISSSHALSSAALSRSPHGECGLKYPSCHAPITVPESLPAWGVWIEIEIDRVYSEQVGKSLPAWGVWIEMPYEAWVVLFYRRSLPAWGVWIEIRSCNTNLRLRFVAPRMGSVD